MTEEEKITKLLAEYQRLVSKLNELNEAMNEVGTDSEDMIPGHDEGAEFFAKMNIYNLYKAQAKSIRDELRKLGYKKAL